MRNEQMADQATAELDPLDLPTDARGPEDLSAAPKGTSILDRVRAKRDEKARDNEITLVIGAYDDLVAVRFRYPDQGAERLLKIGQRAEASRDKLAQFNAMCDVLVTCCDGVLQALEGEDDPEKWPSLDPEPGAEPLRFNRRLAELIELDVPEQIQKSVGRYVVRHFYSPTAHMDGIFRGDPALMADAVRVSEWLEKGKSAADGSLAGES